MPRIFGKIIGALIGFYVGGGPGIAIGIFVGHVFDEWGNGSIIPFTNWSEPLPQRKARNNDNNSFGGNTRQDAFTTGVIVLGAKMAKADGRVTRAKIDAFKRAFKIRKQDEARVGRLFDTARRSAEGFEPYAFSLAQMFVGNPVVLEEILSGLFLVAAADDGGISAAEADFLRSVAFTFNFSPDDFRRIAARTGVRLPSEAETREARREAKRDGASDPFMILGLTEKASNEEIKNAYRTLIRKHHPDRLIAEGMPREFIETANEKMKRINVAYDMVCKMRGIK